MKTNVGLVAGLVFALVFIAAGPLAQAATAAAKAPQVKSDMATVLGKIDVKTEKVGQKEIKMVNIMVTSATSADGKALADLNGKTLKVVGPKCAEVEKCAGKTCEVKGLVILNKEIDATSCTMKEVPAAPAAPAAAPAAPAAPAAK